MLTSHFQSYYIPLPKTEGKNGNKRGFVLPSGGVFRFAWKAQTLHLIVTATIEDRFADSRQRAILEEKEGLWRIQGLSQKKASLVLEAQTLLPSHAIKIHVFNRANHRTVWTLRRENVAQNKSVLQALQRLVRWGLERPLPPTQALSVAFCVLCMRTQGRHPEVYHRPKGRPARVGLLRLED